MSDKIRVLIADDSAITRNIFEKAFRQDGFDVVALVSNARKALDFCRENPVDIVVSDYDMPEMDGIQGCKMITKEFSIPVVIYADDMSIKDEALAAGAALFLKKPSLSSFNDETMQTFTLKVKNIMSKAASPRPPRHEKKLPEKEHIFPVDHSADRDDSSDLKNIAKRDFKILCIGASTGGPTAVQTVLSGLGENFPLPILYTQHLDVGSDEKMAKWFCDTCPNIQTSLAKDGEIAEAGHVYLAPADRHLVIDYVRNGKPVLHLSDEPPERFLRPAVNKLFRSAAKFYREECLAVLMTGMGSDGAEGCKEIIENSGYTICESKSTCTVFGMPAAAIELGAASRVLPRTSIARAILSMVR
ncbi:MAG: response regulator [Treponema sp.]|nr:response regulator [Treponema sp.]